MTELEKIAWDCRAAAVRHEEMSSPTAGFFADIYRQIERLAVAADQAHRRAVLHIKPD